MEVSNIVSPEVSNTDNSLSNENTAVRETSFITYIPVLAMPVLAASLVGKFKYFNMVFKVSYTYNPQDASIPL